jgi:hypothetical protein
MPSIKGQIKTMGKLGIPAELMSQFREPANALRPEAIVAFINQMDTLLSKEQILSIMQEQGCNKSAKVAAPFREFGRIHANKTIEEKVKLMPELDTPYRSPCHLNLDGTLSIYWGTGEEGDYQCVCSKNPKTSEPVSLTFCGCCGGHVRFTYQYALGVNLRLKKIVSSPINSKGKKRCEFLFEVIKK